MQNLDQASPGQWQEYSDDAVLPVTREEYDYLLRAGYENAQAQFVLGALYDEGSDELGIPQDEDVALRWYYQAAIRGHRQAQFSLAWRMHSLLIFSWPPPAYCSAGEVTNWYTAAADQGHALAALQLHLEYSANLEPGDSELAKHWLDVAISLGYDPDAVWDEDE